MRHHERTLPDLPLILLGPDRGCLMGRRREHGDRACDRLAQPVTVGRMTEPVSSQTTATASSGPRAILAAIGATSALLSSVAAIASWRACNEAEKARFDVVESQAKVQGRLTPSLSFTELEHQLGGSNADYSLYAQVSVDSNGAQPIAVTSIEYVLTACKYDSASRPADGFGSAGVAVMPPKPDASTAAPLVRRVGVPPSLGPTLSAATVGVLNPKDCWHELDRVSYPAPLAAGVCDASVGVPTKDCQLNGTGIYSQGERLGSSQSWRVFLPEASSLWLVVTIHWCKFESQSLLDKVRSKHNETPLLSALNSDYCVKQNAWTLSQSMLLCGDKFYDRDCPSTARLASSQAASTPTAPPPPSDSLRSR